MGRGICKDQRIVGKATGRRKGDRAGEDTEDGEERRGKEGARTGEEKGGGEGQWDPDADASSRRRKEEERGKYRFTARKPKAA